MKVIGINGSARKGGNTSILMRRAFEPLEADGIETELVELGPRSVNGCLACMKCFQNQDGHCVQTRDAFNELMDRMKTADGIILGTPVYVADMSAQLKCFIDRSAVVANANGNMLKRKAGAAVVAARRAGAVSAFHSINSFFAQAEMIIVGSTYWNMGFGMDNGEVTQDGEGVQTMSNLGKNMAWLLKSIEASKDKIGAPDTSAAIRTNFIR